MKKTHCSLTIVVKTVGMAATALSISITAVSITVKK
jgi:hypothetical protein